MGWKAYQACMKGGAIVATGHEHSYPRTLTLNNVGDRSMAHGAHGAFDVLTLGPGENFVFVAGTGGRDLRNFNSADHSDATWWASYYTADRWMKNGVSQTGGGRQGAVFIRFYVDGDPHKARGYFKDIEGRIADEFTIFAQ